MNQILRCDWLPERARWSYLSRSGLPAVSRKKNFPQSHTINRLSAKLVWSRWLDIGLVLFFCEFMDLDSVSVHKHAKKELGQYPFILTSHLVNNPYTDNGELELTLFASTRRAVMTDMFCKLESGIKFNFSPRLFSSVIFFALMNLAKISV